MLGAIKLVCFHGPNMNQSATDYDIGEIERHLNAYKLGGYLTNAKGEITTATFGRYNIRADSGIVDINHSITLGTPDTPTGANWVGVQFGRITGDFNFGHNPTITSLRGVPRIINGGLYCAQSGITNFSGIDKLIDRMNGQIYIPNESTHLLGMLLVRGLGHVNIAISTKPGGTAEDILNKYIRLGHQDILSAQDELIDAGFTEQARF